MKMEMEEVVVEKSQLPYLIRFVMRIAMQKLIRGLNEN
jgi:hypothetical protein